MYVTDSLADKRRFCLRTVRPVLRSAIAASPKTLTQARDDIVIEQRRSGSASRADDDGSGLMIGWLMRRGIEPHIPLLDREHQTRMGRPPRSSTCPGAAALMRQWP